MLKKNLYEARMLNRPSLPNGDWNRSKWTDIEPVKLENFMGPRPGFFPEAMAKLLYDKNNLNVIFRVSDRYVRCITTSVNGPVWEDACVEFFFAPDHRYPERYFNLEVNCGGTPLMHYNTVAGKEITILDETDIRRVQIAHSLPSLIDPEVREDVIWTVEYRIPFEVLEKYANIDRPGPGVIWKANFYKIAENSSNPHYITWAEVNNHVPDFHLPEFFGDLRFI